MSEKEKNLQVLWKNRRRVEELEKQHLKEKKEVEKQRLVVKKILRTAEKHPF